MASAESSDSSSTAWFVYPETGLRRKLKLKNATPKKLKQALKLPGYPDHLIDIEEEEAIFLDEDGNDSLFPDLVPDKEYEVQVGDVGDVTVNTAEKVPTSKPKNLRAGDIQRALVCCQAVYEETPEAVQEFLTTELTSHDFGSASVSCYGPVSYMVAETEDKDEVFIAFRGTGKLTDVMANCSDWQQLASSGPDESQTALGGRCHAGFLKLASTIPVDPFLQKYQSYSPADNAEGCHRIVLCGHSLGGAVSHIVALNMLVELKRRELPTDNIMSIAFGAPFFGDEGLRSYVEEQNLSDCLLTVVNQKDPVPRILRLAEAVQTAVTTTSANYKERNYSIKVYVFCMESCDLLHTVSIYDGWFL
ncbi:uncharacterized protein LOC118423420 [Branchiostoma floridae]|uniref:Uncharacterized protein LOC118423420 n=1 Tax=Branchiostoma floridae TaxID=7739 RepID=A0A9J7N124_BRAFL|nr:uncharacterized protein LOC118423420 [Branchiostoma floridae]